MGLNGKCMMKLLKMNVNIYFLQSLRMNLFAQNYYYLKD